MPEGRYQALLRLHGGVIFGRARCEAVAMSRRDPQPIHMAECLGGLFLLLVGRHSSQGSRSARRSVEDVITQATSQGYLNDGHPGYPPASRGN